ncbi:MAG: homocysteine biosynthesis protein [Candidatus Aminicenantaceae bacterium]
MSKTIQEINQKIKNKQATVVTAEEMTRLVRESGPEKAAEKVDVVTTGTFGAMCSSGVWLNFGHSDPPIKIARCWLNDVEGYGGVAAVDTYIGAAQPSASRGEHYGGAHVIEDLVKRKTLTLRAESPGTDCYPCKAVTTEVTIDTLNQAVMFNPRNAYQKYAVATNSGKKTLHTYMGRLLPGFGNATYSGAGELSPLINDKSFRTIGIGTRIFLGGGIGYVTGSGTQHSPENEFGTLMVQGDLKTMKHKFLQAASFKNYGPSLYVGIGLPIPVLDAGVAEAAGISDADIKTVVLDYGVPSRSRPVLGEVSYADLKSGEIRIKGKPVKTTCLSNTARARLIAGVLKQWIENGIFLLSEPVEALSCRGSARPMSEDFSVIPKAS